MRSVRIREEEKGCDSVGRHRQKVHIKFFQPFLNLKGWAWGINTKPRVVTGKDFKSDSILPAERKDSRSNK